MLFKLHYVALTSGYCALSILLGVYMEEYTDASALEIGMLLMIMPFTSIICRPIICSKADRMQAHQRCIITCLIVVVISYSPFIIIPLLGPGVYEVHPRACFYVLSVTKVIGDIGMGGVVSIGDALAINYAERIGEQFGTYRIWGTLSWMGFGLLIGQINEVPFLPKYLPGFLILLLSSLSNAIIIWLWPPEYFVMVPRTKQDPGKTEKAGEKQKVKSLLPKEVVLAHMRDKLLSTITCGGYKNSTILANQPPPSIKLNSVVIPEKPKQTQDQLKLNVVAEQQSKPKAIGWRTQMLALAYLLRGDLRIGFYLIYFTLIGSGMAPLSFFFIGVSKICHEEGTCDFSQLAGALQFSMALIETILLFYIKRIEHKVGRLNLCGVALFCLAFKWTFYSTIWFSISPYWSIMNELIQGVAFAIILVVSVEMGHLFANEIEYVIPKLIEAGVVREGEDTERLKMSLAATMQALISCAMDGIGRGFGALAYGFILGHYSFRILLSVVSAYMLISLAIFIAVIIFNWLFKPKFGFEPQNGELKNEADKV